jgi:hypothetical protein
MSTYLGESRFLQRRCVASSGLEQTAMVAGNRQVVLAPRSQAGRQDPTLPRIPLSAIQMNHSGCRVSQEHAASFWASSTNGRSGRPSGRATQRATRGEAPVGLPVRGLSLPRTEATAEGPPGQPRDPDDGLRLRPRSVFEWSAEGGHRRLAPTQRGVSSTPRCLRWLRRDSTCRWPSQSGLWRLR